ncbi:G-protein coupled receptor Mth2-like isoform X3 [Onthophagus taurus]|uniref:G-protein coupled receptor Mth2-like isoform X3 n=1 Tax=Onthophagus taurus TaxID=166361 RepID=UPI000C1FE07D|nr:G-protein coupled receptor Mth2-like isoform X3 [Onthophagus taurus]
MFQKIIFVILYLFIKFTNHVSSDTQSCNNNNQFTINISDGYQNDSEIIHNNLVYTSDNYFKTEDGNVFGCICNIITCYYKCCGKNERVTAIEDSLKCSPSISDVYTHNKLEKFLMEQFKLDETYIIYKRLSCLPKEMDNNRHIINVPKNNDEKSDFQYIVMDDLSGFEDKPESFCVDYFENDNIRGLLCHKESEQGGYIVANTGMIISMPFLIATFLVYALLPDKNLPAKSLMCYVLSLLFAYIMLVTIQLNSNLEHGACVTIAYLCYFFFMVSFFWMNSSCIDIWLTFSGIKGITGQRTQERKRFIYYCLYSWGLPLIMTSIVVVMTMEHLKDSIFFTAIGDGQCWFKNGLSTGIYFYFPIAILLITNIVLFAITALKIRNVQRDTKVLNAKDSSKHEKDKQRIDEYNSEPCYLIEPVKNRGMQVYDFLDVDNSCLGFNLYIKLLFAMGVNWSMEVISWLVQWQSNNVPTYIWYITDFCNAMYGVLIFFIFVFKKNIWIMLKKRYLQIMGRSTRAHSMGTSTHRTTLFTAISLQSIPGAGLLTKMHSTPNDNRNELRPPKIH